MVIDLTTNILKLNLGCGEKILPGFINVDKNSSYGGTGVCPDSIFNIGKDKYPFDDNSVDVIFLCHVIEHLTLVEACFCLKESYRVLKKDGIVALAFPDFDKFKKESPSFVLKAIINMPNVGGGEHKIIVTSDIVKVLVRLFGFVDIKESEHFGEIGINVRNSVYESRIIAIKK